MPFLRILDGGPCNVGIEHLGSLHSIMGSGFRVSGLGLAARGIAPWVAWASHRTDTCAAATAPCSGHHLPIAAGQHYQGLPDTLLAQGLPTLGQHPGYNKAL